MGKEMSQTYKLIQVYRHRPIDGGVPTRNRSLKHIQLHTEVVTLNYKNSRT